MKQRIGFFVLVLIVIMVTTMTTVQALPETAAVETAVTWETPLPGTLISSSSPLGGVAPTIVYSSDGSQLLLTYLHYESSVDDRRPYFAASIDGGLNWTAAQAIHATAVIDARGVSAGFTADNVAHAAWIGVAAATPADTYRLYYTRDRVLWPDNSPLILSEITSAQPMTDPYLATLGNTIDIVWAEPAAGGGNANIRHVRSLDGGQSWLMPATVANTAPTSSFPALTATADGHLHLVWQENKMVYYVRGAAGGTAVSWSTPVAISGNIADARKPAILAAGNSIHVTFTDWDSTTVPGEVQQYIYYTSCAASCTLSASWRPVLQVSGPRADVNSNAPFFVSATLTESGGCLYAYFESVDPFAGLPDSETEAILGVNSCDNWSAGGRQQVTSRTARAVRPSATAYGQQMQLAYERIDGSNIPAIYHLRGSAQSRALLPIVMRR